MKNKFQNKIVLSALLSAVLLAGAWQGNFSTADPGTVTKIIVPVSTPQVYYNNWLVVNPDIPGNKADAVADIAAADPLLKYIYRDANAKRQTFDLKQNEIPAGVPITNVKLVAIAKSGLATDKIQLTMVKGTTTANISDGPLIPVYAGTCLTGFCKVVRDLGNTNPLTNAPFTAAEINSMKIGDTKEFEVGVNNQQQQNSVLQVTELYMEVQYPDPTPPTGTITIDNDAVETFDTLVDVTLTCNDNGGSGCASVDITVNGVTTPYSISDTPPAAATTVPVTLPAGRGVQTVTAVFKDVAGNTSGPYSDTIILSSMLTSSPPDNLEPIWGIDIVTVSGTVTNPAVGDKVNVDWGSPSTTVPIVDGAWSASFRYPKESMDTNPHTIVVSQVDASGDQLPASVGWAVPVTAGSVTVQKQISVLVLDDRLEPGVGTVFTLLGTLIGEDGNGIEDGPVTFTGDGADGTSNPLADAVSGGLTFESNIVVTSSPDSDNILRLKKDNTITLPPNTVNVRITTKDMGDYQIKFQIKDAAGLLAGVKIFAGSPTGSALEDDVQRSAGISEMKVLDILESDGITPVINGIGGISKIKASSALSKILADVDFPDLVLTPEPALSFNLGYISSTGNAPDALFTCVGEGCPAGWAVIGDFAGNNYYTGDGNTIYYLTRENPGGLGATVPLIADSGTTTARATCDPFVDTDALGVAGGGDRICDAWESGGIPYSGTTYTLPCGDPNMKNIWVEIDYMAGYPPNEAAIIQVKDVLLTHNIMLCYDIDEVVPAFTPLTIWNSDNAILDDFDHYKATYFGTPDERNNADGNAAARLTAKGQAYRYFLWVNGIGGSTGVAEAMGNDAVVAIGGLANSQNMQAGTFMHELGHLLNLNHGGPNNLLGAARSPALTQSSLNCKPNYESVMSYSRQYDWAMTGSNWNLDWSIGRYNVLREYAPTTALTLVSGYTGSTVPVVWGTPTAGAGTFSTTSTPLSAIDWNGSFANPALPWPNHDLNNFNIYGCPASVSNAFSPSFTDYNDYAHLDFAFMDLANGWFDGGDDTSVHTEAIPETTDDVILQAQISNMNFVALTPPPAEDGTGTKKGGSTLPTKVDAVTNDGQEILGASLTVIFSTSSTNYGPFEMPYRVGPNLYQYDWPSPQVDVDTDVCINVYIERPGTPPTSIHLLPDVEILCNGESATNKVTLTP